jgi:hypothetical protein
MEASPSLPLFAELPRPSRGGTTRVQLGSSELILERVRGGHSLLWSDGRQARRYALGLGAAGRLGLQLRAPRLPLRVAPRDTISVAPGARLCGYVHVPLVPTLVWRPGDGHDHVLVELQPNELAAEWDDHVGYTFRCASPWLVRFPMRNGEPRAVVPLRLYNRGDAPLCPAALPLRLTDDDLQPLRGSIVAAPRRLQFDGDRGVEVLAAAEQR